MLRDMEWTDDIAQTFQAMSGNTMCDKSSASSSDQRPAYTPLDATRHEIRLLTLMPGTFQESIRMEMEAVSLERNPFFTALSYCWGDRTDQVDITLNSQTYTIGRNLAHALGYWRSEQEKLTIWVDAICINQLDNTEKQHQVGLMGKIYSSAAHVRVWLGVESHDSDLAMDFIEHIHKVNFDTPTTVVDASVMTAVKNLIRRDWWTRLWIVQEALLAQTLTIHCGWKQTKLGNFIKFQEEYARLRWDNLPHLQAFRSNISGPLSILLWSWDDYRAQLEGGGISLSQIITVTSQSRYSEPLDRIFALLGMCSNIERQCLPIDYSMSMRDLNILVSRFFLLSRRHNLPLYYLQFHQSGKDTTLPSWASDFSTPDEENHVIAPSFRAGADNKAWGALGLSPGRPGMEALNSLDIVIEVDGILETLVVPGLVLDEIKTVLPSPWIDIYDGTDVDVEKQRNMDRRSAIAEAVKGWWMFIQKLPPQPDPYIQTCGRCEAFWRTLVLNHGIDVQKGPVSDEMDFAAKFAAWTGVGAAKSNIEQEYKAYSDAAVSRCMWRSLLVTRQGYLGLGPQCTPAARRESTCVSDILCVLRGAHAPYILRARDDGCYSLIGEAYVHGMMDGTFVREARTEDLKTFRIR